MPTRQITPEELATSFAGAEMAVLAKFARAQEGEFADYAILPFEGRIPLFRKGVLIGSRHSSGARLTKLGAAALAVRRDRDAAPRKAEGFEAEGQQPGPERSEGIAQPGSPSGNHP